MLYQLFVANIFSVTQKRGSISNKRFVKLKKSVIKWEWCGVCFSSWERLMHTREPHEWHQEQLGKLYVYSLKGERAVTGIIFVRLTKAHCYLTGSTALIPFSLLWAGINYSHLQFLSSLRRFLF